MNILTILFLLSYSSIGLLSFYIGYIKGRRDKNKAYMELRKEPLTPENMAELYASARSYDDSANSMTINTTLDDISEHIVHAPTAEELNKMNESQEIKEAKEAIQETLDNAPVIE